MQILIPVLGPIQKGSLVVSCPRNCRQQVAPQILVPVQLLPKTLRFMQLW